MPRTRRITVAPISEDSSGDHLTVEPDLSSVLIGALEKRDAAVGEKRIAAAKRLAQLGVLLGALAGGTVYGVRSASPDDPPPILGDVEANTRSIRAIAETLVDLQDAQAESVRFFSAKIDAMSPEARAVRPDDYDTLRELGEARDARARADRAASLME